MMPPSEKKAYFQRLINPILDSPPAFPASLAASLLLRRIFRLFPFTGGEANSPEKGANSCLVDAEFSPAWNAQYGVPLTFRQPCSALKELIFHWELKKRLSARSFIS